MPCAQNNEDSQSRNENFAPTPGVAGEWVCVYHTNLAGGGVGKHTDLAGGGAGK